MVNYLPGHEEDKKNVTVEERENQKQTAFMGTFQSSRTANPFLLTKQAQIQTWDI